MQGTRLASSGSVKTSSVKYRGNTGSDTDIGKWQDLSLKKGGSTRVSLMCFKLNL